LFDIKQRTPDGISNATVIKNDTGLLKLESISRWDTCRYCWFTSQESHQAVNYVFTIRTFAKLIQCKAVVALYEPYKESIANVNLPEPLRLPNGANDEVNVTEGLNYYNKIFS
jgi:hypothetical protein